MDTRIVITIDATGAIRKVQDFDQALHGLGRTTSSTSGLAGQFEKVIGSLAGQFTIANMALGAFHKGVAFLKDTITESIKAAVDYEKATKGLDAAFEISGRRMPGMTQRLKDYANELQALGLADDAAILKAESLIMQISTLDEKGIKVATRGAIGLASVFEMDLSQAAEMAAKGMEGTYRALNLLFPSLRQARTEGEKHAELMRIFEKLYARAIADTGTYAGQIKALGLSWGEVQKNMGQVILQSPTVMTAMQAIGQAARAASEGGMGPLAQAFSMLTNKFAVQFAWLYGEELKAAKAAADASAAQKKLIEDASGWGKVLNKNAADLGVFSLAFQPWLIGFKEAPGPLTETGKALRNYNEELAESLRLMLKNRQAVIEVPITELVETAVGTGPSNVERVAAKLERQRKFFSDVYKMEQEELKKTQGLVERETDYFAGLYNDIAIGFGNTLQQWTEGMVSFAEFFAAIWESIKQAFFRVIGEMIAKWLVFKALLSIGQGIFSFLFPGAMFVQGGFHGVVSTPTPFIAGEAGAERVDVTPIGRRGSSGGGGEGSLTVGPFYIYALDGANVETVTRLKIIPILEDAIKHNWIRGM